MRRQIRKLQIGAWLLVLIGLASFGLAGVGLLKQLHEVEQRKVALASEVPTPVAIEEFNRETDVHPLREVRVIGQLDVELQYDLIATTPDGDRLGVMIPLYPAGAENTAVPAPAVLLYDQGPGGETIGDAEINTLVAQIDGEGGVGPMITLGGTLGHGNIFGPLIADSFAEAGRPLAENVVIIFPFRTDRATALASGPQFEQLIQVVFIAAGFTLVGMILLAFARNRLRRLAAGDPADATDAADAAPEQDADDLFSDYAPEVNPVNGAVIIPSYAPEMADGSNGLAVMREVLAIGRSSEETGTYTARRDGIDDFAALDSGGLKRALPGRGIPEKLAGPKPVKKESPLAAKQDPTQAADIMAAVQAEITAPTLARAKGEAGDIFAAVQAAVGSRS
ncbi:hypothetical protein FHY55_06320 [Oceanicola sp. D3]|uniref:hypothetical protein n=1 Tax=Oceanicola sp. D3 TaxID=2587163 RepID=UPI0011241D3E|nr:hypothetical protein [Oceanicola sp. D3]QDC08878.1 hypothetical protein FHY55_06320 [Oceanicola sp. D3]